ncbi:hypothetical protein UMNF18_4662 [Escherichia coli UMNF18]|nr:hypothetical protein UMNF18_4662 [Escherichia coli UMNF18]EII45517.1 hypothetical protein EC23916_1618 [Escherichia coli 2.3916]
MFLLLFRSMNKQENRGVLYQQDLCRVGSLAAAACHGLKLPL